MSARADVALQVAAAALDLHEGISDPLAFGCQRWPEELRLLNHSTGELVPGRCKATNLCRYCQRLYVIETVEMLTLDAVEYAPTLWGVLTAREHLTRRDTYRHLERLRAAARKRWAGVEWFVQVEFQRRGALHLNLLFKGVPEDDVNDLRDVLVERWCARVDARPVGQWFGEIADAQGVVRYLSKMLAHGLKAEQAPPIGWRGHRTSQTRGYLVRPASAMREEARRALRIKRAIHRGVEASTAQLEVAAAELTEWSLRHVAPGTIEVRPSRIAPGDRSPAELPRVTRTRLQSQVDGERPVSARGIVVQGDDRSRAARESISVGAPARREPPPASPPAAGARVPHPGGCGRVSAARRNQ